MLSIPPPPADAKIPADFLDRLLIVSTEPYDVDELRQILAVRSVQEETDLEETAMELLTRIARETSLRYAMQLIALSKLRATKRIGDKKSSTAVVVAMEDVEAVYNLFYDVKRSARFVLEHSQDFLFHEDMNGAGAIAADADVDDQPQQSAPSPMVEG
jgi:RuvB-like protein 2